MSVAIPLIRGFALLPALGWLAERGVAAERALADVDLSPSLISAPFRPVPLVAAAAMLQNAARRFGPDVPYRIVSGAEDIEIAMLGKLAVGSRTAGEALTRILAALPYYCSHEHVLVDRRPREYVIREFFAHRFDDETKHLLLQYAAAMVDRILGMSGAPPPRFARLEMPPHPRHGIEHLRDAFGTGIVATRSRGFTAFVNEEIMHRPFASVGRDRLVAHPVSDDLALRGDGTFSGSVRLMLMSMIESDQAPTMKRAVAAAGTSARSFQRHLEAEGTTFSNLLAEVRRSETLRRLGESAKTIAAIASDLGYSDQATFTRAFRRWSGLPPGRFRARTP